MAASIRIRRTAWATMRWRLRAAPARTAIAVALLAAVGSAATATAGLWLPPTLDAFYDTTGLPSPEDQAASQQRADARVELAALVADAEQQLRDGLPAEPEFDGLQAGLELALDEGSAVLDDGAGANLDELTTAIAQLERALSSTSEASVTLESRLDRSAIDTVAQQIAAGQQYLDSVASAPEVDPQRVALAEAIASAQRWLDGSMAQDDVDRVGLSAAGQTVSDAASALDARRQQVAAEAAASAAAAQQPAQATPAAPSTQSPPPAPATTAPAAPVAPAAPAATTSRLAMTCTSAESVTVTASGGGTVTLSASGAASGSTSGSGSASLTVSFQGSATFTATGSGSVGISTSPTASCS